MRRCCSVCGNRLIKETSEDLGSFVSVDWWWLCVTCGDTRDQDLYEECHRSGRESNPMPDRAVVAISDDRQSLVVLDKDLSGFSIYEWDTDTQFSQGLSYAADTGQSADDVLRDYLREREP